MRERNIDNIFCLPGHQTPSAPTYLNERTGQTYGPVVGRCAFAAFGKVNLRPPPLACGLSTYVAVRARSWGLFNLSCPEPLLAPPLLSITCRANLALPPLLSYRLSRFLMAAPAALPWTCLPAVQSSPSASPVLKATPVLQAALAALALTRLPAVRAHPQGFRAVKRDVVLQVNVQRHVR